MTRGRLIYCYQGTWHTVCANGWDDRGQEAQVVCNIIGHESPGIESVFLIDLFKIFFE